MSLDYPLLYSAVVLFVQHAGLAKDNTSGADVSSERVGWQWLPVLLVIGGLVYIF
jgi:hypothetical protein